MTSRTLFRRSRGQAGRGLIILLVLVVIAGWAISQGWCQFGAQGNGSAAPREITPRGPLTEDERATIEVFRSVAPSVVNVAVKQNVLVGRDFFRNYYREVEGTGSGFVWDEAGHIVTNYHVIRVLVEDERSTPNRVIFRPRELWGPVNVRLADGAEYEAEIVGFVHDRDLAVLKIQVDEGAPMPTLHPVDVGTSTDLVVGQKVLAIGSPFGLDQTLTVGIVSALGRSIDSVYGPIIYDMIQTDAAINPGNSGGPLLDSAGRLIGVNTAIASPSRASAGVGFAVPVDIVNHLVPQLIAYQKVIQPAIGVQLIDPSYYRALGVRRGVLIGAVQPGTGAEAAGLQGTEETSRGNYRLGDIILEVDNKPVNNYADLLAILKDYDPGDSVNVKFEREGEMKEVQVRLSAPGE